MKECIECPLNKYEIVDYNPTKRECVEKRCAWWVDDPGQCAVVSIADRLSWSEGKKDVMESITNERMRYDMMQKAEAGKEDAKSEG
tara:strand:+ start:783 stop:1040 length:258 start_codon:yes stop_codon:yes gene_type:complete